MRIAIVGLGLIGASIARALKVNTAHTVDGWNRTESVSRFALENGYIDGVADRIEDYDVVFIALPPDKTMEYLDGATFKDNAIVTDICGVKGPIEDVVYQKERNYRYVGSHPMAGKATTGIQSSTEKLFKNANIVICEGSKTEKAAEEVVEALYLAMGAGNIIKVSAKFHDEKIAYTSQLAHIVSNAYIKSKTSSDCIVFTGGSFQDLTRVAPLDEKVWTQLFYYNRNNLEEELETFVKRLQEYLSALKENDHEKMKRLLTEGKEAYRVCYDKKK